MMRKALASLVAATAMAVTTPVLAQDRSIEASATEDFQCAVWVSIIASTPLAQDPEVQTGFNVALGFFVGRYEGLTGRGIDEDWNGQAAEEVVLNLERFATICGNRMDSFGGRLQRLGAEMIEYSERGAGSRK
ncbi:hypothetical protein [Aurantiacibacter sp. D1-12]|uniref:hypothetical protein n=1 Tax=Aurantiacibacter sp. D1-12 TaxID=2993658 RepID=UPI00237C7A36|nr:hypothetical protein [Aurantiacibacter sp. D1-12]MDE1468333.1 hypothetical protein [Aurantiacibacter sp. D1-12]